MYISIACIPISGVQRSVSDDMLRLPLRASSSRVLRPRLSAGHLAGASTTNTSELVLLTTRVFSSSIFDDGDDHTPRDSAAALRAMRNGEDVAAANVDDDVDYRYRNTDETSVRKSPLDLWGETAARNEQERQRQNDARSQSNPMPPLSSLLEEDEVEDTDNDTQRPTLSSIYNEDRDGRRLSSRRGRGGSRPNGKKKFVSFFDEVDDLIEKRRADKIGTSMNRSEMGSTLANLLDKLDNYPDPDGGRRHDTDQDRSSVGRGQASRLGDDFSTSGEKDGSLSTSLGGLNSTGSANSIFSKDYVFAPSSESARSIFETDDDANFEPEPVNPNAYDREAFEQYETLMREELERERFIQMRTRNMKNATEDEKQEFLRPVYKWLLDNQRTIPYDLPALRQACQNSEPVSSCGITEGEEDSLGHRFRGEIEKQKASFLEETGLTPEQYEVAEKAVLVLATNCAKRARAAPVEVMWEKIKESGMMPPNDVMSTLLYIVSTGGSVLSTFSRRDSHRGGSKFSSISSLFSGISGTRMNIAEGVSEDDAIEEEEKEEKDDSVNIQDEVALCHDMLYEPTDNSTSLRVKGLISKGDAQGAERLLERFASKEGTVVRLRSYLPILSLYCQRGEVNSALNLFKRMRNTETVHLEPENYIMLISSLAEHGCFCEGAEPIDIATDLGYSQTSGLGLFDELVTEMAEDVLEITSASARKMYNALAIGFKDQHEGRNLQEMHSLAGMRVFNDVAELDEVVASRISVDHETGVCPRTKARLRLVMLDEEQRKQLRASLAKLAASETAKFARGNKQKEKEDAQRAVEEMSRFSDWLE